MKKLLLILLCLPMIGFGQCKSGDCKNGYGIYLNYEELNDKYAGEWKGGKMNGQGVKTWPSGEKAVGEFMEDKPLNVTLYDKEGKIKKKWGKGRDLFYNK